MKYTVASSEKGPRPYYVRLFTSSRMHVDGLMDAAGQLTGKIDQAETFTDAGAAADAAESHQHTKFES